MAHSFKPGDRISYLRAGDKYPTLGIVLEDTTNESLWIAWDKESNPSTTKYSFRTHLGPVLQRYVTRLASLKDYDLEDIS